MSTSNAASACCTSGKLQHGKPSGRETVIAGLDVYVSEPKDGAKTKSIIMLCDLFGWKLNNVRLLADSHAEAGFYVYVPDLHQGDSLPEAFLNDYEPPLKVRNTLNQIDKAARSAKVGTTLGPWLVKHREGVSKPLIDGLINIVKHIPGTDHIGVIGFCWGGRYAILCAAHNDVDAVVAYHPNLLAIPGDIDPVKKPLYIGCGSRDSLLVENEVQKLKDALSRKPEVPSEVELYEDQVHGFALRGDWSSDNDKAAMDRAERQGRAWLHKHLS